MTDDVINAERASTSHVFEEFCVKHDLITTALGIDRHGSYVWEAGADVQGLSRYITLGLTQLQESPEERVPVIISLIISADDGSFFTNVRFRERPVRSIEEYLKRMPQDLETAWGHALDIAPEMLNQRYIAPHSSPEGAPAYASL